jgi:sterol desaturase/sphingolipid hydroxylase (fatty acid hydroxylase superfamily)
MVDLTVAAVPFYFGSMEAERRWLAARGGDDRFAAGQYERRDTVANLTMGVASLLAPLVSQPIRRHLEWGRGRAAKPLVGLSAGAALAATVADALARRWERSDDRADRERAERARQIAGMAAVTAIASGGVVATSTWTSKLSPHRLWGRRRMDLGNGPVALGAAIAGWDFIYYWNHRLMHESRFMWAIHVPHHSSEHYNLSVALRQPVADLLGTFVPYGLLCLIGVRPELIETARGVNLLYQYWIHTETIPKLGRAERVLNTASHHRVHHGSNPRYIDRNHGSILIIWDRLFGTFEPEDEPVVYGLTKNIGTFSPIRIAVHEYLDIARDIYRSRSWRERLSFVLRGPGWAYEQHRRRDPTPVGHDASDTASVTR